MKTADLPFNISLMKLSPQRLAAIKPVLSLDIYDGISSNFHEDGLFSVSIFGRTGDDMRDTRFSYIDIKTEIFHPVIFDRLCRLKALYKGIMMGTAYATWNDEEKDFVGADEITGETGYSFFMSHWRKIEFKITSSNVRDLRIKLIQKYKDVATTTKILVMPAGLRDLEIDANGRQSMDDINGIYWRIISISNTIGSTAAGANDPVLDVSRKALQEAFNEIYANVETMLTGKSGFIQSKWGSRRVFNGTRNVISAMDTSAEFAGAPNHPKFTDSVIGLYQLAKGALPVTIHSLNNGWLSRVFGGSSDGQAILVDKKTLRPEHVKLPADIHDGWTTTEGLEKLVSTYAQVPLRNRPIEVEGRWLGLIYAGPDKNFRIFNDIEELPEKFDRKYVQPLTLCHLIYLSGYKRWNTLAALITRYPIAGTGSIYPSFVYVKTTIIGEMRYELGQDWERIGEDHVALEFPTEPANYVDSLIPHPTRLAGLVADFDGDTASANILYSDEALAEVHRYLSTKEAFLDPKGGFRASAKVDTVELVLRSMTGD